MPDMRTPDGDDVKREAEDTRTLPVEVADNDEYVVSYVHRGKKLHVMYVDHDDNRSAALDSAVRTARSDGVEKLRVFRRPKGDWVAVDWR